MKNKMVDLRNHLFATLEALQDKDNPMDVQRAHAIQAVAAKLIESAKVEVQVMRLTGSLGTGFIPVNETPELPAPYGEDPKVRVHRVKK